MPVAALLNSPEALRAAGWGALQAALGLGTAKYWAHLNKTQRDLYFLYYQPFLPMLAMLWLWGTAVRFWERRRIRYDVCFSPEDQRYMLRSSQLFQVRWASAERAVVRLVWPGCMLRGHSAGCASRLAGCFPSFPPWPLHLLLTLCCWPPLPGRLQTC